MKEKIAFWLAALFLVALTGTPVLFAEEDSPEAPSQAPEAYSDPSASNGGEGPALEDSGQDSGSSASDVVPSDSVEVPTNPQEDNYSE